MLLRKLNRMLLYLSKIKGSNRKAEGDLRSSLRCVWSALGFQKHLILIDIMPF